MFNFQEIGDGTVRAHQNVYQLQLPTIAQGYANAQIDNYAGKSRRVYPCRPTIHLSLYAKFSHAEINGTAGFGFWNAPYGDPTLRTPTFPNALWFFYASSPNDLPFLLGQTGWFAATIAVNWWQTFLAPLALLNWLPNVQPHLWPRLTRLLGIRVARVPVDLAQWQRYEINWLPQRTIFRVNSATLLNTTISPKIPLGFVAWIDNQYLIATPRGRFGSGVLEIKLPQQLYIRALQISSRS